MAGLCLCVILSFSPEFFLERLRNVTRNVNRYRVGVDRFSKKSRLQFQVLGSRSVTAFSSRLRTHNYKVLYKLVNWRYVLGACDLIHIFVFKERNCNKHIENIRRKIKKKCTLHGHQFPEIFNPRYILFS
jgi:hypothetical protein